MYHYTLEDIAELKAHGIDASIIAIVEKERALWPAAEELCRTIESAFAGVTLGNGIGLQEAQGLDDYEGEAVCAAYRAKDEKEDWRRLSAESLNQCYSSLNFFDAEGMRFHLPAFLLADIRNEYHGGMISHLTHDPKELFSLLSRAQRLSVRSYLLLMVQSIDHELEAREILHALETYWMGSNTKPPPSSTPSAPN